MAKAKKDPPEAPWARPLWEAKRATRMTYASLREATGICNGSLSNYIHGQVELPRSDWLALIARALGIPSPEDEAVDVRRVKGPLRLRIPAETVDEDPEPYGLKRRKAKEVAELVRLAEKMGLKKAIRVLRAVVGS